MSSKERFLLKKIGRVVDFEMNAGEGEKIKVFCYAKSPDEVAQYFGTQGRFSADEEGDSARQQHRAKFIADSMVEDDGKTPMFTEAEAKLIPITVRVLFVNGIIEASNTIDKAVKKS